MEGIPQLDTLVPNAYHGTSKSNAENIIREKKFRPSSGPEQYLGDGVYFFEGSRILAQGWAEKLFPGQPCGIIIAKVLLGRCLNLSIPEHRELLKTVRESIQKLRLGGISDAVVLNYLLNEIDSNIDTVRCHFGGFSKKRSTIRVRKIFSGSRIVDGVYIVICVKTAKSILDFSAA